LVEQRKVHGRDKGGSAARLVENSFDRLTAASI
jgi:hypothetical protein